MRNKKDKEKMRVVRQFTWLDPVSSVEWDEEEQKINKWK